MIERNISSIKNLAHGSYGAVYKIEFEGLDDEFAAKRNFNLTESNHGVMNLREASVMKKVKGHPFIVNLIQVIDRTHYFDQIPFPKRVYDYGNPVDDEIHFLFKFENYDLQRYTKVVSDPEQLARIFCQVLLAIEYIHSKGIVHGDLKPDNILFDGSSAKICDFGMSDYISSDETSMIGNVCFRAPEVCCRIPHGPPSDIWSLGITFFSILFQRNFLRDKKDSLNAKVIAEYITRIRGLIDAEELKQILLSSNSVNEDFVAKIYENVPNWVRNTGIRRNFDEKKMSIQSMGKMPLKYIENYDSKFRPGGFDCFVELIAHMLEFNHDRRKTATQLLDESKIFKSEVFQKMIAETRSKFPVSGKLDFSFPVSTNQKLFEGIYERRTTIPWYTDRILFHSIQMYENVMTHHDKLDIDITTDFSKFLIAYTCLYTFYKFFNLVHHQLSWIEFCPDEVRYQQAFPIVKRLEIDISRNIYNWDIFSFTPLEGNQKITPEETLRNFFYPKMD